MKFRIANFEHSSPWSCWPRLAANRFCASQDLDVWKIPIHWVRFRALVSPSGRGEIQPGRLCSPKVGPVRRAVCARKAGATVAVRKTGGLTAGDSAARCPYRERNPRLQTMHLLE